MKIKKIEVKRALTVNQIFVYIHLVASTPLKQFFIMIQDSLMDRHMAW